MTKRITIKEIAKLAGVNPSTVSRVLNPRTSGSISAAERERIKELCDKYNYRPRAASRGCATGKSYRVGLVLSSLPEDFSAPFFGLFMRGLCDHLQKNGYSLSILWADHRDGKLDEAVRDILMSDMADGYVIGVKLLSEQFCESFYRTGRPIIALRNNWDEKIDLFPTVEIDPVPAFAEIWKKMPGELRDKVLFFGPDTGNSNIKFTRVTAAAPENCRVEKLLFYGSNVPLLTIRSEAVKFLRQNASKLLQHRVIWCSSDLVAMGVCDILRENSLVPGRDIYVIGYDNLEAAGIPGDDSIPLAGVDPDWEGLGTFIAGKMLACIDSGVFPEKGPVKWTGKFVSRQTFPF